MSGNEQRMGFLPLAVGSVAGVAAVLPWFQLALVLLLLL